MLTWSLYFFAISIYVQVNTRAPMPTFFIFAFLSNCFNVPFCKCIYMWARCSEMFNGLVPVIQWVSWVQSKEVGDSIAWVSAKQTDFLSAAYSNGNRVRKASRELATSVVRACSSVQLPSFVLKSGEEVKSYLASAPYGNHIYIQCAMYIKL